MRYMPRYALFIFVSLAVGCSTTGNQFRSVSYSEAIAFEQSQSSVVVAIPSLPEKLYIQPLNKNEPCKLPSSKEQLERRNFRAYWDGQCKDGYAYGLGRDIAISDTHHYEEITIHNGEGDNFNAPAVNYDFINNSVVYRMKSEIFPAHAMFSEYIQNDFNGFNVMYTAGTIDGSGNALITQGSPLNPTRVLINDDRKVVYKFTDNTSAPIVNPSAPVFVAETLDSKSKRPGGFMIVRYGNGQIRNFKVKDGQFEPVALPKEYLAIVNSKYNEVTLAHRDASSKVENARRMEREYLHMACSGDGDYKIDGVNTDISSKICSWRSQFKEPFNVALEKYNAKLVEMKQTAQGIEQQRLYQEQIALQQRIIDQQKSQQEFRDSMNALSEIGKQMQNSGMQMQQYFLNQSSPQVAPLSLPRSNQINCVNVGSVTNCRY